jgi:hypothetical protein
MTMTQGPAVLVCAGGEGLCSTDVPVAVAMGFPFELILQERDLHSAQHCQNLISNQDSPGFKLREYRPGKSRVYFPPAAFFGSTCPPNF